MLVKLYFPFLKQQVHLLRPNLERDTAQNEMNELFNHANQAPLGLK